jgi:putative sugar O-methyltransferase
MNLWTSHHARTITTDRFRAHNQYLSQDGYPYEAMWHWCMTHHGWMLEALEEDGAFGAETWMMGGRMVSRDLLDSVAELGWLWEQLGYPQRILDIGAGYGRIAHRLTMLDAEPFVFCTDPIDISRDVCERYLSHRAVTRAMVVKPRDLGQLPGIDLAINVHSWPECTLAEVNGWMSYLERTRVPSLYVVPHGADWACIGGSILDAAMAHGYRLRVSAMVGPVQWARTMGMFERRA